MHLLFAEPIVAGLNGAEPCATCGARPFSACNAVPNADLALLASAAIRSKSEPGRAFVIEGDPADSFFNITGGTARLYKSLPDGRRQIVGFAGRGHFLGLSVANRFSFTAEAIDTVTYCRFTRARLCELLDDVPALERRLLQMAATELAAAQMQMLLLGRKTARERVASFLLARGTVQTPCERSMDRILLPMTRVDIADYLGLTIETVSRTMTKLKEDGIIAIPHAAEIIIKNRPMLQAQAGDV